MLKTLAMPLMMAFRIPAMPLTIALRQAPMERKIPLMQLTTAPILMVVRWLWEVVCLSLGSGVGA